MEVLRPAGDDCNDRDAPPPKGESPQEDGPQDCDLANHVDVDDTVHVEVEVVRQSVGHADKRQGGERRGADVHEQTRAVLAAGKAVRHQATHHVGVHEERDAETEALGREAAHDDGRGDVVWLGLRDDRSDGARQHDGEDGQYPRRHHSLDLEVVSAEDVAVLAHGQEHGDDHVTPERHLDSPVEVDVVGRHRVAVGARDDGGEGEEEGREEEALALVSEGRLEVAREHEETGYQRAEHDGEHDQVSDVDDEADDLEARELVGLRECKQGETTGTHDECPPCPGEVV